MMPRLPSLTANALEKNTDSGNALERNTDGGGINTGEESQAPNTFPINVYF